MLEREKYPWTVTQLRDAAGFSPGEEGVLVTLKAAHILPFSLSNSQVRRALCFPWSGYLTTCGRAWFRSTYKCSRETQRFKIFFPISMSPITIYFFNTMYTMHSGISRGEFKRRPIMGIADISPKHSGLAFTSSDQESETEQNCNFLVTLATSPRISNCVLSTSLCALSLPPAVRQMFSTSFSNTIRTSLVLYLGHIHYPRMPARIAL
jgi:hypothetical protein